MMAYTTTDLLSAVSRRAFSPTDQQTFSNADILALADEEIETLILPEILSAREEYLVTSLDVAVVNSQAEYDIPARAVGNALREVKLIVSNEVRNLPRIELEDIVSTSQGQPEYFYLRENKLGLYPTPSASQNILRLWFHRFPSKLVETFAASQIATISGNTVSLTSIPPLWTAANTFDFINSDGANTPLATDVSATGVSGNDITFASLPAGATSGLWVALAGESPVLQLPREYRTVLAQAVTVRILDSLRLPGSKDEMDRLKMMLEQTRKLISPRVVGENRTVVNKSWLQ